jgi:hypothetical protein
MMIPTGETREKRKRFPILGSQGQAIDFQLVADHGKQAQANHYQTVAKLAERGGLSWCELHAVLHNRPWVKMDTNEAIIACRALEARYLAAIDAALASEGAQGWRTNAARDVLAERERQVSVEGWTPEHDDRHDDSSLAFAGVCYAYAAAGRNRDLFPPQDPPPLWPRSWARQWWKPSSSRRDLVKAAALILAEIERLDRANPPSQSDANG